jgi:hypothetical protein
VRRLLHTGAAQSFVEHDHARTIALYHAVLPRCIASHRIAMMRLQMKTLVGALSSCKSVAFE